ncbi:MAG: D-alanyl-D-alanine carboxypeptidase [uncultured Thermomicrobiales bacterium]|uniref:D-alanyl-D-alanine carboxypeptidase n=1 Tax=uncultured Thermomicrobiales bacterium TaxID=1645740 RepID=A0A6J4USS4_9BACT|nr:MAG: D-alanyl-D-alanine carboxypeptidase [uncultured Thermomicrobiales bacterium]
MMLPSGNDAARAIARDLGYQPGDTDQEAVDRFIGRINQRVKDMGLNDTNLVTPDGWGVPGHHSSVYDLAAFMMYALQYPRFVDVFSTRAYETSSGYYVTNTNRMLNWYDGIVGGKTGFDFDAGYCLIEVAERDGNRMISVTLDGVAPDDWYDDNRVLLDYAFAQKAAGNRRQPLSAGVVAFKDPDAAFIAKHAAGGASLGLPAPVVVNQPLPAPAIAATAPARGSDTRTLQLLAALGVAALLIAARVAAAVPHPAATSGPGRRGTRLAIPHLSFPRPNLTVSTPNLRRTSIGKTRLPRRRR